MIHQFIYLKNPLTRLITELWYSVNFGKRISYLNIDQQQYYFIINLSTNYQIHNLKMISLHRPAIYASSKNFTQGCNQNVVRNFRSQKGIQNVQEENPEIRKNGEGFMGLKQTKQEILETFSQLLKNIVKANGASNPTASIFNIKGKASIEIQPFVKRISDFINCSHSCYIVAIILLDRLQTINQGFVLCAANIHKLIITAMMISAKYCDDDTYRNTYYAKIGGIQVEELNNLESQFLSLIRFEVYVGPEVYENYSNKLKTYLKKKSRAKTEN